MEFLKQDRPKKVKEIYSALKRDHPTMPAEMKARIAARQGKRGKQKQGPPYKGPITPWKEASVSNAREQFRLVMLEKEAGLFGRRQAKWEAISNPQGKDLVTRNVGNVGHPQGAALIQQSQARGAAAAEKLQRGKAVSAKMTADFAPSPAQATANKMKADFRPGAKPVPTPVAAVPTPVAAVPKPVAAVTKAAPVAAATKTAPAAAKGFSRLARGGAAGVAAGALGYGAYRLFGGGQAKTANALRGRLFHQLADAPEREKVAQVFLEGEEAAGEVLRRCFS